jgi:hypothetical protein
MAEVINFYLMERVREAIVLCLEAQGEEATVAEH